MDLDEQRHVVHSAERLLHPVEHEPFGAFDVELHEQAGAEIDVAKLAVEGRPLDGGDAGRVRAREERAPDRAPADMKRRASRLARERAPAQHRSSSGQSPRVPCERPEVVRVGLEGEDMAVWADGACGEHRVDAEVRATVHDREARPKRTQEEPDVRGLATRARREEASVSEMASEVKTLDPAAKHRPAQLHERCVAEVANDAERTGETGRSDAPGYASEAGQHRVRSRHPPVIAHRPRAA